MEHITLPHKVNSEHVDQQTVTETSSLPVNGVSWLAARVIANLNMALEELHCNMIIVSIVQQDTIVLSCGHLHREP